MIMVGVASCSSMCSMVNFAGQGHNNNHKEQLNVQIIYWNGSEDNEHAFVGVINGLGMNCLEVDTEDHAAK